MSLFSNANIPKPNTGSQQPPTGGQPQNSTQAPQQQANPTGNLGSGQANTNTQGGQPTQQAGQPSGGNATQGGLFGNKPATTDQNKTGQDAPKQGGLFGGGTTAPTTGAPANLQSQTMQNYLDRSNSEFAIYLKAINYSNDYLLNFIISPKPSFTAKEIKQIFDDKKVVEKLSKGLKYYQTSTDKEEAAFKEAIKNKTIYWPTADPNNRIQISPIFEKMIIDVRKKLDISFTETKNLFDLFFESDKPAFRELLAINYNEYTFNQYEVTRKQQSVMKRIIDQYYKERIYLLDCIYELLAISVSQKKVKHLEQVNEFVNKYILKKDYIDGIWKMYQGFRETKIEEKMIPDTLTEIGEKEEWILQTLKEEFYLLKIIFIAHSSKLDFEPKIFVERLETFGNQKFYGSYLTFEKQLTVGPIHDKIEEFKEMIADMTIMILLNFLRLDNPKITEDILTKEKTKLKDLFEKYLRNQLLAPLTYVWVPKDSSANVSLESIIEIEKRPLFLKSDKFSKSYFRRVIINWVGYLSNKLPKDNLQNFELLLLIAGNCLKEEEIGRFWKGELGLERLDDIMKKIYFDSISKHFSEGYPNYIEFLIKLLGNKRDNYILNIWNVLKTDKCVFWSNLYNRWTEVIYNKKGIPESLIPPIKLICKILIYDNEYAQFVNEFITFSKDKTQSYHTISMLLLDTIYYFRNDLQLDVLALLYKTLGCLQSNPACSSTIASLIQLYPKVIVNENQPIDYPSAHLQQSLNLDGNYHPLLEIFNIQRRSDLSLKNFENKYKLYVSVLKLAYEIVLNNEYIYDQYPSEKYVRDRYPTDLTTIDNEIQQVVNSLINLHNDPSWSRKYLAEVRDALKYKASPIKYFSNYSFIEDILKIVYKVILESYEKMVITEKTVHLKWKIGNYLFKISDILLRKYLVNLERFYVYQGRNENLLLQRITSFLNGSKLGELILKTLEVVDVSNDTSNIRNDQTENPLGIENKIWYSFVVKNDLPIKRKTIFKNMLASCLGCLETLTHLIEIYHENKVLDPRDLIQQPEINKLHIVDEFDKILTKKEFIYTFNYLATKNLNASSKGVKINIILALLSYINFEHIKSIPVQVINPEVLQIIFNSKPQGIMSVENDEDEDIKYTDGETIKNIFLKSRTKNNTSINLVSSFALRILSRLVILWEEKSIQGKLSLLDFTSVSINESQGYNSRSVLKLIYQQFLIILVNYNSQAEDACALIEFLTVCLYSQRGFIDTFLKNIRDEKRDYFKEFIFKFCDSKNEVNRKLLIKVLIFLYEVFQRENEYHQFVNSIRKKANFDGLFECVFLNLVPDYDIGKRLINYGNLTESVRKIDVKKPEKQFDRLSQESQINSVSQSLFGIIIATRFLSEELIKSKADENPENSKIPAFLKKFFSLHFLNWIRQFTEFGIDDPSNDPDFRSLIQRLDERDYNRETNHNENLSIENMSYFSNAIAKKDSTVTLSESKRYKRRAEKEKENSMALEGSSNVFKASERIVMKGIYKMMDINLYGYGKDFVYDTQEIYFALKNNNIEEDFIFYNMVVLNRQNLINSVFSLEHKCLGELITLFKFCSTLGTEGQAFSSSFYNYSVINVAQDIDLIKSEKKTPIFEESKQLALANPNAETLFSKGMTEIFQPTFTSNDDKHKIKLAIDFIECMLKSCWNSIKDKDQDEDFDMPIMKALDQKINLLTYALNALYYLLKTHKELVYQEKLKKKDTLILSERTEQGLEQIILSMFEDVNEKVLTKAYKGYREYELDITPYVSFELALLLCTKEINLHMNYWDRYAYHLELLEKFMNLNINCLSLVISCFEVMVDINPLEFYNYVKANDCSLIKFLISKISHENFFEVEFAFIMKLFVKFSEHIELAELLDSNNLVWELCTNKRLKKLIEMNDYEGGVRNTIQILWCWVLILMKQMLENLNQSISFMSSALTFLKEFSPRIYAVLKTPNRILGRRQQILTEQDRRFALPSLNMAYFEELECTTALLTEYFNFSSEWTHYDRNQFELVLYMLTHFTLDIVYIPRDSSKIESIERQDTVPGPISLFEKNLKEIQSSGKIGAEKPSSGSGSLVLKTNKSARFNGNETLRISVFEYKIQISIFNSLIYTLESIKNGLKFSNLLKYFNEFDTINANMQRSPVKYEVEYWENFSSTLINVVKYINTCCSEWQNYGKTIESISKKYDYINNSVQSSMQTFGLNHNFQSYSILDLRDVAQLALETAYCNLYLNIEMSKCFVGLENIHIKNSIKAKAKELIDESKGNLSNIGKFSSEQSKIEDKTMFNETFFSFMLEYLE